MYRSHYSRSFLKIPLSTQLVYMNKIGFMGRIAIIGTTIGYLSTTISPKIPNKILKSIDTVIDKIRGWKPPPPPSSAGSFLIIPKLLHLQ